MVRSGENVSRRLGKEEITMPFPISILHIEAAQNSPVSISHLIQIHRSTAGSGFTFGKFQEAFCNIYYFEIQYNTDLYSTQVQAKPDMYSVISDSSKESYSVKMNVLYLLSRLFRDSFVAVSKFHTNGTCSSHF